MANLQQIGLSNNSTDLLAPFYQKRTRMLFSIFFGFTRTKKKEGVEDDHPPAFNNFYFNDIEFRVHIVNFFFKSV